MRCLFCGAEWKVRISREEDIHTCPFCKRELSGTLRNSTAPSLINVFRSIVNLYGKEIMANGQRVTALLSDFAPVLQKEKRVVIAMSCCKGNELLYGIRSRPKRDYLIVRERICAQMEEEWGISPSCSSVVCDCFWDALQDEDVEFPAEIGSSRCADGLASSSQDLNNHFTELDAEDCYALARAYEGAAGVTCNIPKAIYWLERSANRGYVDAQVRLAAYYYRGIGTQTDKLSAVYWLEQAVAKGNCAAQLWLAKLYANGDGTRKNEAMAARLFELAANQGSLDAQLNIARCYKDGTGVGRDGAAAAQWLEIAAGRGSKEAQYKLALMYDYGDGVERDAAKAARMYQAYYTRD